MHENVRLSILAAAALHGEEAGEAEDEEDELTDHCGCGEAQVGTGAFILSISLNAETNCSQSRATFGIDTADNGRS